ncbi:MAG: phosphotransferase [Candidatus Brocadiaceae bacterium]|nr:phosphotransferase [Candidatus Brocadiaceae bacterium]
MDSRPELTRDDLRELPSRVLRRGLPYKADLFVYDTADGPVVLKDYAAKRGIWRRLGVIGTGHEARALRALSGLDGVPRFRGRPDRFCVAMTLLEGRKARRRELEPGRAEAVTQRLDRMVAEMHARGVVHLDLKHRSNLLISEQDTPLVLDFESALCFNPACRLGRLLLRALGSIDRLAVLNWKRRLCPNTFSGPQMARATWLHHLGGLWVPRALLDGLFEIMARRPPSRRADDGT